jgi:hypothetical protein
MDNARSNDLRKLCEEVSNAVRNDEWALIEVSMKKAAVLCPHPWYYKNIMRDSYSRTVWFTKSMELFEDDPEGGRKKRMPGPNINGQTLVQDFDSSNTNLFNVMTLLANGADPNERSHGEFHRAPLHFAVEMPPIMVELLLEYNTDPNAKTSAGHTPLTLAGHWAHSKRSEGRREEFSLICKNIELLLLHGAQVSAIDQNDWRFTTESRII